MTKFLSRLNKAVLQALANDVINTAKAVAYSGMLMLFPAMLVITTLLAQVPEGNTLVGEIRASFEQFMPADTMDLLQSYVLTRRITLRPGGSLGHQPQHLCRPGHDAVVDGGFSPLLSTAVRDLGFLGTPLARPAAGADRAGSAVVGNPGGGLRPSDRNLDDRELRPRVACDGAGFWRLVRWSVAFGTSTAVLTVLYHFGTKRKEHWLWVAPGAAAGTLLWSLPRCFRLVCDPDCRLLHVLRLLRRRHRHPGLALYHRLQRAGGSGTERRLFPGAPGAGFRFPPNRRGPFKSVIVLTAHSDRQDS